MSAQVIATKSIHYIPGRLRIAVKELYHNREFAEKLTTTLREVSGIQTVSANALTGRALITFDAAVATLAGIQQHIEAVRSVKYSSALGRQQVYKAAVKPVKPAIGGISPRFQLLNTVITGGILAALIVKRIIRGRSMLSSSQRVFNLAAITTIIAGYPMLKKGIGNLVENKKINHDLLISVATLVLLTMRESLTGLSVLWLVQLSGLLQAIMEMRARQSLQQIISATQSPVVCLRQGRQQMVEPGELAVGDTIIVRSGEHVPVDGVAIEENATINQAAICGQYLPILRGSGDDIQAGSLVETGELYIRVEAVGDATAAARIANMVERSTEREMQSGEVFSARLLPWTVGIAALLFLFTRDVQRTLAVLLAGCPAAVALASNTTFGMASIQATRQGIFLKDVRQLARAEQLDTVVFDKTGTLTQGRPQISDIVVIAPEYDEEDIVAVAAGATQYYHPFGYMLAEEARRRNLAIQPVTDLEMVEQGFKGRVKAGEVHVGSEICMKKEHVHVGFAKTRAERLRHLENSVLYVAVNRKVVGLVGIRDPLRDESVQAIEYLRAAGMEHFAVVSGDHADSTENVAQQLGITEFWGNVKPEKKARIVTDMMQSGRQVVMVGDGINDVPAMRAANMGIVMGTGGSDRSLRAADAVLCSTDLRKVADTMELGKQTMQVLRQNLTFAAGFNTIGIALAAAQWISPVTAALFLNMSTLGVIFNACRLLRPGKPGTKSDTQTRLDLQQFSERTDTVINRQPIAEYIPEIVEDRQVVKSHNKADCWHAMPANTVCTCLEVSAGSGMSEQAAVFRCGQYGKNALIAAPKTSFYKLFLQQFKDFMVQVLLGAAGLSLFLGHVKDALLTCAIVVANAGLGAFQESNAEKSLDALSKMAAPSAKVLRNGQLKTVHTEELVPGDVIVLEAGDRVPADARLIKSTQFEVEEASLTGEPIPVKKSDTWCGQADTPLGDRKNMVFMGTSVTRGRAYAVVVATGMKTEMGKIAGMLQHQKSEPTPLQLRLEEMGKAVVAGCLAVAAIVFIAGILRGQRLLVMVQTAASLAVAAIPEGLSAIVIIALAMGVQRMAKQNILVRKMSSIETLGCAQVICSDKTGTLTKNEMTVRKIFAGGLVWEISGEGYAPRGSFFVRNKKEDPCQSAPLMQTLLTGALCNNAKLVDNGKLRKAQVVAIEEARQKGWSIHGDPTEGALLVVAGKAGLSEDKLLPSYRRIREIPFESERRMMSVVCCGHDQNSILYCKGAADRVLAACTCYLQDSQVLPLTDEKRSGFLQVSEQMAHEALRVLATAYRNVPDTDVEADDLEEDLVFCGLVGMIDPPRPEVPSAIAKCKAAGVKVVMITGDHPNTAKAIAQELGLMEEGQLVLTGEDIDNMADEQLTGLVGKTSVYARTAPHHKLRIIKAFKEKGFVVAMTGDGVNDAPAIKAADIGIAMGIMGTDVTKEAASMTLADDNFATIVKAMEEGRSIYNNIRKAIRYALATNLGEVALMFFAVLMGLPLPLIPLQLLWINLIGDGLPVLALVNDPPPEKIMQQPPRSAEDSVFSGGLGRKIITRGIISGIVGVAAYVWKLRETGSIMASRTMAVVQVALSQMLYILDCRIEKDNAGRVGLFSNKALLGAVSLSLALIGVIVYWPTAQGVFQTVPLRLTDWLVAALAAAGTAALDGGVRRVLAQVVPEGITPIRECVPAPMPEV